MQTRATLDARAIHGCELRFEEARADHQGDLLPLADADWWDRAPLLYVLLTGHNSNTCDLVCLLRTVFEQPEKIGQAICKAGVRDRS